MGELTVRPVAELGRGIQDGDYLVFVSYIGPGRVHPTTQSEIFETDEIILDHAAGGEYVKYFLNRWFGEHIPQLRKVTLGVLLFGKWTEVAKW